MPDNYSQWEAYERGRERWRESRPVCEYCGEHIQDDFCYEINGDTICIGCLDKHFRKEID